MLNQRLSNIVVIKPILVILLVFYHAFAIYGGSWEPLPDYPEIAVYWWLDKISYACMLELFVFVSGYLFGFQVRTKGAEKLRAKNLFGNKLKRLIIPSIVFSFIYLLLYDDISQPVFSTFYHILLGVGHMWFLPMLFLCFVGVWSIERIRLKPHWALMMLLLLSLLSINGLPFDLSLTMYYLVFFYLGYCIQRYNINIERYYSYSNVIISVVLFIISFVSLTILREHLDELFLDPSFIIQTTKFVLGKACQITYSFLGIAMVMLVIGFVQKDLAYKQPQWVICVGNMCFGVYLFQQFFLQGFYYHTTIPSLFGPILLPWVCFIVTLIVSLLATWMFRLTRVGRFLLG